MIKFGLEAQQQIARNFTNFDRWPRRRV